MSFLATQITPIFDFPFKDKSDAIAISLGPIEVRWYALAYMAGILLGWWMIRRFAHEKDSPFSIDELDDYPTWGVLGIMLGARLGYILFYKPTEYFSNPIDMIKIWEGGMSFHGGLIGITIATLWFAHRKGICVGAMTDAVVAVGPIGLGLGRIANFINGELWGRVTDSPLGMVFPTGGPDPRHPSQLYEAALEGVVLFILLNLLRRPLAQRIGYGALTGIFFIGYGVARSTAEFFRQPDEHLGFIFGDLTMGQLLSMPMILIGTGIILYAKKQSRRMPEVAEERKARTEKRSTADKSALASA